MKAVVFDMDGVLIDTHKCAYRLLADCAATHGVSLTADQIMRRGSMSSTQFWGKLKKDYNLGETVEQLIASYDVEKEIAYYAQIGLMPGVTRVIAILRAAGIALGLATSAEKRRVDAVLSLANLTQCFDSVVAAEDIRRFKPDPECYLTSCRRLACKPADTLVIEDSANGANAAKAAGCRVAAFHGSLWEHNHFAADLQISDFGEIKTVEDLVFTAEPKC